MQAKAKYVSAVVVLLSMPALQAKDSEPIALPSVVIRSLNEEIPALKDHHVRGWETQRWKGLGLRSWVIFTSNVDHERPIYALSSHDTKINIFYDPFYFAPNRASDANGAYDSLQHLVSQFNALVSSQHYTDTIIQSKEFIGLLESVVFRKYVAFYLWQPKAIDSRTVRDPKGCFKVFINRGFSILNSNNPVPQYWIVDVDSDGRVIAWSDGEGRGGTESGSGVK